MFAKAYDDSLGISSCRLIPSDIVNGHIEEELRVKSKNIKSGHYMKLWFAFSTKLFFPFNFKKTNEKR